MGRFVSASSGGYRIGGPVGWSLLLVVGTEAQSRGEPGRRRRNKAELELRNSDPSLWRSTFQGQVTQRPLASPPDPIVSSVSVLSPSAVRTAELEQQREFWGESLLAL